MALDRVVDGDTFIVADGATQVRVRLIGVNAPEHDECFGSEASAELSRLLGRRSIRLETDVRTHDDYGRLLAYVYADDHFVNVELVEGGFAIAQAYPPNLLHQVDLDAAMVGSEAQRTGMWAARACGAPSGRVTIEAIASDPPGPDGDSLNEETVTISSLADVSLDGWVLRDGSSSHRYRFPDGFSLSAGTEVTVHTGCGIDSPGDLYWCSNGPVWDNEGDTAIIYDESGALVTAFTYSHE